MRTRTIWITLCIVFILLGTFEYKHIAQNMAKTEAAFSNAILQQGSGGHDVQELQGRLDFLGYYEGEIDGVFGSKTRNAVTTFQQQFGMKADGIVGTKTKQMLMKATANWEPSASKSRSSTNKSSPNTKMVNSNDLGLTKNDFKLMAKAVYAEARGEPYEGQVAVAAVILNRVRSVSFPNTVEGVIFQPLAFTAVDDGQISLTPNQQSDNAVQDACNGWDPTGGCLYYFNPRTATSEWIWRLQQVKTIGRHIFCL